MRVALVIGGGVPNPQASGSTVTTWTIARHLIDRGHETIVVPLLLGPGYVDPAGATLEQRVAELEEAGATVVPVRSRAGSERSGLSTAFGARVRRWLDPPDELLYPTLGDRDAMRAALERVRPDVVLAFHWEALAALDGVHVAPKFGVAIDPSQLPHVYRWRAELRSSPAKALRGVPQLQAFVRRQPGLMVRFLRDCDASANFAAHHAAWLRRAGATDCRYFRLPVPDPLEGVPPGDRVRDPSAAPRLLFIGHFKGIATLEGLDLFAGDVLPRLERALGPRGFEVRLVGGYDPPPALRRALERPSVTLLRFVPDIGREFFAAEALVVPTPIKLGTRVRILTAFSYGCPVVAHVSNALGIPELEHERNALLAGSGRELAEQTLRILGDSDLRRRLGEGARETFERFFSPPVAAGRIEEELADLARRSAVEGAAGGRRRGRPVDETGSSPDVIDDDQARRVAHEARVDDPGSRTGDLELEDPA